VSAAIHRFEGQAMTYMPDQGPCYRCLFPASSAAEAPSCAEAGVLGVLPGVLGALQATEAIKVLLGIGAPLVGRLMTFDALAMAWHEFRFQRRADCAVCGPMATIKTLSDSEAACRTPTPGPWPRLKPSELQQLIHVRDHTHADPPLLVDVREGHEYAAGHLTGSTNIPLSELANRLAELTTGSPVVFICRSGGRSSAACGLAARGGVQNVSDLEGGLTAWAAAIDPSIKVV
jgi:adenylyltransferase/sulfurtransferase